MGAKFTLFGDSKGAVKAVNDLNEALKKTEKQTGLTNREQAKLDRQARRVVDWVDPVAKYNRQIEETARLLDKKKITQEQAERAVRRYREALENAGRSQRDVFGSAALQGVLSFSSGLLSVSGAIGAVISEFRTLKQLSEEAAAKQAEVAGAEGGLRRNIFALPADQREQLLTAATRIARTRNLPQAAIENALGGTISATGDPRLTIALTQLAARFTRRPEEIPVIAAGLGDIIAGSDIRTPEDALGFLALTQGGARVVDPAKVAQNVSRVLSAFTAETAGGTAATAGGLFAALTKGGADPTGEVSRTAAIRLISQTQKFFADRGRPAAEVDTVEERLALLLGDKTLARQFLAETTFEAGAEGAIAKLFLQDPTILGAFRTTQQQLRSPEERITAARRALSFVGEGPLQQTEQVNAALQSLTEQIQLGGGPALTAESVRQLARIRGRAAGFQFGQELLLSIRRGATITPEEAIAELEAARADVLRTPSAGVGAAGVTAPLNEQSLQVLQQINETLADLRNITRDNTRPQPTARQE